MKPMRDSSDLTDLAEDYRLYRYLTDDLQNKLSRITRPSALVSGIRQKISEELNAIKTLLSSPPTSDGKREIFLRIRELSAFTGSLLTADAWQSPSFAHIGFAQHGNLQGKITAHSNDYTRDQHAVGNAYAASFIRQYVTGRFPVTVYGFATTSGMSAYSVAALFVHQRIGPRGMVVMGSSTYFENKDVLHALFGDRLVEIDDTDDVKINKELLRLRPDAVFFDTLANHPSMATPDPGNIIASLPKGAYCVLDNSAFAIGCGPLFPLAVKRGKIRLLVAESLNKFHQFGMDRATGGIVWGTGAESILLYDYRDRFGMNISDISSFILPTPERNMLGNYMERLGRNARYLAEMVSAGQDKFSVTYPGLRTGMENRKFSGAYFVLNQKSANGTPGMFESYIRRVFRIAARKGIRLVGGTSFGLPVTRLYAVGMRGTYAQPFLRISPGTETVSEIQTIGRVLLDAI